MSDVCHTEIFREICNFIYGENIPPFSGQQKASGADKKSDARRLLHPVSRGNANYLRSKEIPMFTVYSAYSPFSISSANTAFFTLT